MRKTVKHLRHSKRMDRGRIAPYDNVAGHQRPAQIQTRCPPVTIVSTKTGMDTRNQPRNPNTQITVASQIQEKKRISNPRWATNRSTRREVCPLPYRGKTHTTHIKGVPIVFRFCSSDQITRGTRNLSVMTPKSRKKVEACFQSFYKLC